MNFQDIYVLLVDKFGDKFQVVNQKANQPIVQIPVEQLIEICRFLHEESRLLFDYLACLTAIDTGLEKGEIEVIYYLTSLPYEHNLALKTTVSKLQNDVLPTVPSVTSIWKTADWHEREAFDLVGIYFKGHPDLRRILLPNDWQGHPLRKDYKEAEFYHGIKVNY